MRLWQVSIGHKKVKSCQMRKTFRLRNSAYWWAMKRMVENWEILSVKEIDKPLFPKRWVVEYYIECTGETVKERFCFERSAHYFAQCTAVPGIVIEDIRKENYE